MIWPMFGFHDSKRGHCHCITMRASMVLLDADRNILHGRCGLLASFWCQVLEAKNDEVNFVYIQFTLKNYFNVLTILKLTNVASNEGVEWRYNSDISIFRWPVQRFLLENTLSWEWRGYQQQTENGQNWPGWAGAEGNVTNRQKSY